MRRHWKSILRWGGVLAVCLAAIAVAVVVWPQVKSRLWPAPPEPSSAESDANSSELVAGQSGAIRLAAGVADRLGMHVTEVQKADKPVGVELPGTLSFDADRLSHVHSRFAGEVVEIGMAEAARGLWISAPGSQRPVVGGSLEPRPGREEKRTGRCPLAVAPGSREPESLDQSIRRGRGFRTHHPRIATKSGIGPDCRRTDRAHLQSWRVPAEEIDSLRAEAKALEHEAKPVAEEHVHRWARSEVRAPLDGVILEKNIALGDLVDTNLDLFKVADLSRLRVMAHAYEEQLPLLDNLAEPQHRWTISVQSDTGLPPLAGRFEQIGKLIDPNEHAALVTGWVDNRAGRLRAGQFITAKVELPIAVGEVAIPSSALVEEGQRQFVFVQPDPAKSEYVRRPIAVSRRDGKTVFAWSAPTAAQRHAGAQPLHVGERVVSAGVVQLAEALRGLEAAAPKAETP